LKISLLDLLKIDTLIEIGRENIILCSQANIFLAYILIVPWLKVLVMFIITRHFHDCCVFILEDPSVTKSARKILSQLKIEISILFLSLGENLKQ